MSDGKEMRFQVWR